MISMYDYKWLAVCVLSHGRRVANVDQIIGCDGQVKNNVDDDDDGDDGDHDDDDDNNFDQNIGCDGQVTDDDNTFDNQFDVDYDDFDDQGVDRKLIINMFADSLQCPKLHMKPKIFIFQVKYKLCSAIKFHKYKRIDT